MDSRKNVKILKPIIMLSVVAIVIIVVCIYISVSKNKDLSLPATADPVSLTGETEVSDDIIKTFKYTEPEIRKMILDLAKKRFGDDAYVIPLNTEGPSQVEIEGKSRYVYIYAADSLSKQEDVDNIKGLYHVDPVTGEIFDNGSGKMEKVQLEVELNEE